MFKTPCEPRAHMISLEDSHLQDNAKTVRKIVQQADTACVALVLCEGLAKWYKFNGD